MKQKPKLMMILGKVENTGIRKTGRIIYNGPFYREEVEACPEARVVVWSRDSSRFDEGREFAAKEGYQVFVEEDRKGALDRVREKLLRGVR